MNNLQAYPSFDEMSTTNNEVYTTKLTQVLSLEVDDSNSSTKSSTSSSSSSSSSNQRMDENYNDPSISYDTDTDISESPSDNDDTNNNPHYDPDGITTSSTSSNNSSSGDSDLFSEDSEEEDLIQYPQQFNMSSTRTASTTTATVNTMRTMGRMNSNSNTVEDDKNNLVDHKKLSFGRKKQEIQMNQISSKYSSEADAYTTNNKSYTSTNNNDINRNMSYYPSTSSSNDCDTGNEWEELLDESHQEALNMKRYLQDRRNRDQEYTSTSTYTPKTPDRDTKTAAAATTTNHSSPNSVIQTVKDVLHHTTSESHHDAGSSTTITKDGEWDSQIDKLMSSFFLTCGSPRACNDGAAAASGGNDGHFDDDNNEDMDNQHHRNVPSTTSTSNNGNNILSTLRNARNSIMLHQWQWNDEEIYDLYQHDAMSSAMSVDSDETPRICNDTVSIHSEKTQKIGNTFTIMEEGEEDEEEDTETEEEKEDSSLFGDASSVTWSTVSSCSNFSSVFDAISLGPSSRTTSFNSDDRQQLKQTVDSTKRENSTFVSPYLMSPKYEERDDDIKDDLVVDDEDDAIDIESLIPLATTLSPSKDVKISNQAVQDTVADDASITNSDASIIAVVCGEKDGNDLSLDDIKNDPESAKMNKCFPLHPDGKSTNVESRPVRLMSFKLSSSRRSLVTTPNCIQKLISWLQHTACCQYYKNMTERNQVLLVVVLFFLALSLMVVSLLS